MIINEMNWALLPSTYLSKLKLTTWRGRCLPKGKQIELLKIDTNVKQISGVVEYKGDVCVYGDVHDGMTIQATGDVSVWGNVNGCIEAGCPSTTSAKVHYLSMGPQGNVYIGGCLQSPNVSVSSKAITPYDGSRNYNSRAVEAALITGIYASVLGLAITVFPHTLYGFLFNTSLVTKGIIRLGGAFLTTIGIQYLVTALSDARTLSLSFYHSTIISRCFLITITMILICIKALERNWALFALMNTVGAFSMARSLYTKPNNKVKVP